MTIGAIRQYIYSRPLQQIILWICIAVFLWGIVGFVLKNKVWFRGLNRFLLLVFTLAVLYMTVFSRTRGVRELVMMPFYSFAEARNQPEMYRTMLMNVFMFLPVGLCLPFGFAEKTKRKGLKTILLAMIFSVIIELIQYLFALGRCETDDVIMNTLGAGVGSLSYLGNCCFLKIKRRFSSIDN